MTKQLIIEKDIIKRNYENGYSKGIEFASKVVFDMAVNTAKNYIHPKLLVSFKNKLKKEINLQ